MVTTVALAVSLAGATVAYADAGPGRVALQVTAVRAGESGVSDPELVKLRPRLRRLVGYRSFQVVGQEERHCGWHAEEHFTLPGDRSLQVLPKALADGVVKMELRLLEGHRRLVDTNVRLLNRGTMMFGVGRDPRMGEGALIIMIKAEAQ
jgi:hypothetical protein